MKLWLSCLVVACSAGVIANSKAPKQSRITEIVLEDTPGFVPPPYRINKIVLRADGRAYWLSGTTEKPVRHSGPLYNFDNLVALFEEQRFFAIRSEYGLRDVPNTALKVVFGNQQRRVEHNSGGGPQALWVLEMAVRGVASTINWQAPIAEAKSTPKPTAKPTATPIPIIRGTQPS
jgi:hypothetical protein